ncbi:SNF5-domain-containing protein [Tothia fuscella]|uniref:SNF5-domain-containing protein n=1 Tax=Tothia fuscella TaxID=1048955 RepID=A0A9P4P420_9PEZI|nr:SNF5-domain-containing protein [Tothia fuscella]
MPSPVVAADSVPPTSTNEHKSNNTTTSPNLTTNSTDARSADTNEFDSTEVQDKSGDGPQPVALAGSDAIREGKEKAKAIMAASGMNVAPNTEAKTSSAQGKQTTTIAPAINGVAQLSRKRSRSGSRRPTPPPKSEDGQRTAEDEYGRHMLEKYRERDQTYFAHIYDQDRSRTDLMNTLVARRQYFTEIDNERRRNPAAVYGEGYHGYGNIRTDHHQFQLVYPAQRKRLGHRRAKRFHIPRTLIGSQADQVEELVPMRLDIEFDKIKLRDTFTWNLQDRVTPIDAFAETLVEDFLIPPEAIPHVTHQVTLKIQEQLYEYYPHVFIKEEALDTNLPYHAYKNDEMRILVKLNITIGPNTLVDQFEWDINNPLNSPEQFATAMCHDLSLSGEFATAIAHQIREQSQMFSKSLYITAHPFDGRPIEDVEVRDAFLPSPMNTTFRPQQMAKEYSPYLWELSESDLQREELSILREQRRQKRSVTRRGGPALPDLKDRERTVRTLVVSSVIPGASETLENARVFKLSRISGRGRRAARVDGGGDDSDESETDESELEEAAQTQITGGTARTRGMRGAAIAAQGAMRAHLGRSTTPELASLHHHETRHTSRRFDPREESVVEPTKMVVLRIPREKYRQWLRNYKNRPPGQSHLSSTPNHPGSSSMPPPLSTPARSIQGTPAPDASATAPGGQPWKYYPDGKVDAPTPPPAGLTPPPPPWLSKALQDLHQRYPQDSFEAIMRYTAVRRDNEPIRADAPVEPENMKYQWLPRVRCTDCPGKLYTPGPEHTLENFEVHLRNRAHKTNVEARTKRGAPA